MTSRQPNDNVPRPTEVLPERNGKDLTRMNNDHDDAADWLRWH